MSNSKDAMLRSLAKTGILALVDEATGYQMVRAKDELRKYFGKSLIDAMGKDPFNYKDKFFEDILKLHKLTYNDVVENPSFVGDFIDEILWQRMELKGDVLSHIYSLHALAQVSDYNLERFMQIVEKVFPKRLNQNPNVPADNSSPV